MPGEVANITEVATKVSKDIFKWFKWDSIPVMDMNFSCHKPEQHMKQSKSKKNKATEKHTHPIDVVLKYFDPYLNKIILLNTDLKSYSRSSINSSKIKEAICSLAKTIDCARGSAEWQDRYVLEESSFEVRGMLFIYNHDNGYDKDFFNHLKSIKTESIGIKSDQIIHIIDPQRIRYLSTVIADMMKLHADKELPRNNYTFFYPDLYLHKSHGNSDKYPATIELLCSPFMIIKHDRFNIYNEITGEKESEANEGYIIYYNQDGSSDYEFMYLFDSLSRFQILSSKAQVKIRVAHHKPSDNIKSNYKKAINNYIKSWCFDEYKKRDLDRIELEIVNITQPHYNPGILSWRYE